MRPKYEPKKRGRPTKAMIAARALAAAAAPAPPSPPAHKPVSISAPTAEFLCAILGGWQFDRGRSTAAQYSGMAAIRKSCVTMGYLVNKPQGFVEEVTQKGVDVLREAGYSPPDPPPYTDRAVVERVNKLARLIYKSNGYEVVEGYRFDKVDHPQEQGAWNIAALAYEFFTGSDPYEAVSAIEGDEDDEDQDSSQAGEGLQAVQDPVERGPQT